MAERAPRFESVPAVARSTPESNTHATEAHPSENRSDTHAAIESVKQRLDANKSKKEQPTTAVDVHGGAHHGGGIGQIPVIGHTYGFLGLVFSLFWQSVKRAPEMMGKGGGGSHSGGHDAGHKGGGHGGGGHH